MPPDTSPLVVTRSARTNAVGAGADATVTVAEAPFAATVTSVSYTPDATITGANTNTRTISVVNKAQDGTGSTVIATLALTSGVNIASNDEGQLTLSATPANVTVAAGDEIAFASVHAGSGIADPGGLVQVEFTRS